MRIVMATKITKKMTTETEYAERRHGASLFFFFALIEP